MRPALSAGIETLSVPIRGAGLPELKELGLAANADISSGATNSLMSALIDGASEITDLDLSDNKIQSLFYDESMINEGEGEGGGTFETLLFAGQHLTSLKARPPPPRALPAVCPSAVPSACSRRMIRSVVTNSLWMTLQRLPKPSLAH